MSASKPDKQTSGQTDILMEGRGLERTFITGEVSVHALRGVDISLKRGELVVLLGHSGSGKSTLLNILGGLDRATAGTLNFDGHDLTHASDDELTRYRRRSVGFVFQFYNLVAGLTAKENVSLVTEISKSPMKPEEALELVRALGPGAAIDLQLRGPEDGRPGRRFVVEGSSLDVDALAVGDRVVVREEIDDRPGHGGEGAAAGRVARAARR